MARFNLFGGSAVEFNMGLAGGTVRNIGTVPVHYRDDQFISTQDPAFYPGDIITLFGSQYLLVATEDIKCVVDITLLDPPDANSTFLQDGTGTPDPTHTLFFRDVSAPSPTLYAPYDSSPLASEEDVNRIINDDLTGKADVSRAINRQTGDYTLKTEDTDVVVHIDDDGATTTQKVVTIPSSLNASLMKGTSRYIAASNPGGVVIVPEMGPDGSATVTLEAPGGTPGGSLTLAQFDPMCEVFVLDVDRLKIDPIRTGPGIPKNTALPRVTGTTTTGSVLTSTTGTWTGAPTSYAYQWKRDGSNRSGETAATYTLVSGDETHSITCAVTATNASGASTAAVSNAISAIAVPGSPPTNTLAPAATPTGTQTVGTLVGSTDGTWDQAVTLAGSWQHDIGAGYVDISGAPNPHYLLAAADGGFPVRRRITATNAATLSATAYSNAITCAAAPAPPAGLASLRWGYNGTRIFSDFNNLTTGLAAVADSGVSHIRIEVDFDQIQATNGASYNWALTDSRVMSAAVAGLTFQPAFMHAPVYARKYDSSECTYSCYSDGAPRMAADGSATGPTRTNYLPHMTALLVAYYRRYGVGGTFWAAGGPFLSAHPGLPIKPQIMLELYNEWQANKGNNWGKPAGISDANWQNSAVTGQEYIRMYRQAWLALHAVDNNIIVLMGGLTGGPSAVGYPTQGTACSGKTVQNMQAYITAQAWTDFSIDAMGFHGYAGAVGTPSDTTVSCFSLFNEVRAKMQGTTKFKDVPIVGNEIGWVTTPNGNTSNSTQYLNEAARAAAITEMFVTKANFSKTLNVASYAYYCAVERKDDPTIADRWRGLYGRDASTTTSSNAWKSAITANAPFS